MNERVAQMTPNEVIGEFEALIRIANYVDNDYCETPFKIDFLQGAIDIIKAQEEKIVELQKQISNLTNKCVK